MGVQCKICGKRLRTRYNLNIHMAVHTGAKPYICDTCGKGFQQKWNLITHLSRVHEGEKPFQCQDCGRTFGYASHFKAHVKVHFLEQHNVPDDVKKLMLHPFACKLCTGRFKSARLLEEHMPTHTGLRPYNCNTCGKTFLTKRHIVKHFQRRCNAGVPKKKQPCRAAPTPCEICGKVVARYSMPKHLNIHTRKRTYPCKQCNRTFLESGQLTIHERTHSGLKPHICEVCGKAHAQLGNLLAHRRRHHSLTDKPIKMTKPQALTTRSNFFTDIAEAHDQSSSETINNYGPKTQAHCTGNETIKDFLEIADLWITERVQESKAARKTVENSAEDEGGEQAPSLNNDDENSLDGNNEDVTSAAEEKQDDPGESSSIDRKQEVTDRIINEIGEINSVKTLLAEVKKDRRCTNDDENSLYDSNEDVTSAAEEKQDDPGESSSIDRKQEVTDRIINEIGEINSVKTLLAKAKKEKRKDILNWIIRRLGEDLPKNSVVERVGNGSYVWQCWDCQITQKTRPLLLRHRLVHAPPHLRPYVCKTCGRTFTQAGNFKHHLLVHKQEYRFFCEICSSGFRHKSHYTTHRKRHDSQAPAPTRFQCDTCGKTCQTRFHLAEHIRTHTKERPYLCRICGRHFGACSTYTRHLRRHDGGKEECVLCGKAFKDASSRRRHQAAHNTRSEHVCVCGKTFTQKSSLKRHVPICSKAPSPATRSFRCIVCPKVFLDASGLKRHAASHDPTRRFPCQVCNLMLKSKDTLGRHLARHRTND